MLLPRRPNRSMRECCMQMMKYEDTHRLGGYPANEGFTGRTNDTHDVEELILVVSTTEERNATDHLSEDATTGPHINRGAIRPGSQKNVWGTVPQSHNLRPR